MAKKAMVKDLPNSLLFFYKKQNTEEARKTFLEHYNYLLDMQSVRECQLSAESFDLLINDDVFVDKKTINKILKTLLFSNKEFKEREKTEFNLLNLSRDILTKLNDCGNNKIIQEKQKDIKQLEYDIQTYYKYIETKSLALARARKLINELALISDTPSALVKSIDNIARAPEFSNFYLDENLIFHAVCDSKFEADGEIRNFGKFDITFDFSRQDYADYRVRIFPFENNLMNNEKNRFHPHLFELANLCWGTATSAFTEAVSSMKIDDVYKLAYHILNDYNPHSSTVNYKHYTTKMSPQDYKFVMSKVQPKLIHPATVDAMTREDNQIGAEQ